MNPEEFESLSFEEQERIFHQSPFKEKGEIILYSHQPEKLIRSLSQEELYLTAKEMDTDEKGEIIRYATLAQLFFISDIDCWKGDRIDPEGFVRWLEVLQLADDRKLLIWLQEMDYETVVACWKKVIAVIKPEREYATDEVLGDTPYFTLDQSYYIYVREGNLETVRRAMEILYENKRGRYFAILEGILSEMEDVIEDEAFGKREMRLAERGFPEPEIAHRIYRPITPEEFWNSPPKNSKLESPHEVVTVEASAVPNYMRLWAKDRLFFDDVLLLFRNDDTGGRESLQEELAWLSNKAIACEGINFSSEEMVRCGVERARHSVNIGLELLSGRDVQKAAEILRTKWLETVFRWGATPLFEMREQVFKIIRDYWEGNREAFLAFLNPPYTFIFRGLLKKVPECYDASIANDILYLRDFCTVEDVEKTRWSVRQIQSIHEWLSQKKASYWKRWKNRWKDPRWNVSMFSLLGTLFTQSVDNGKGKSKELEDNDLKEFSRLAFNETGSRRILKSEYKEKFLTEWFDEKEQDLLRTLWGLIFNQMEEDFEHYGSKRKQDSCLMTSVICRSSSIKEVKK